MTPEPQPESPRPGLHGHARTSPAPRRHRAGRTTVASLLAVSGLVAVLGTPGQAEASTARTPNAEKATTFSADVVPTNAAPVSGPSPAEGYYARPGSKAQQRARLDRLARALVAAGAPGVIVRVDDGRGEPIEIAEQATWTLRDHRIQVDDEVRMGSNTKTMMATLVLQLVGEGKLTLTDPVDKWLPGRIPNGRAITLRMLLNHTSGLFDYTQDPVMLTSILGTDRRPRSAAQLLDLGTGHDPLFAPGSSWSYSNTNYIAVGAVLEKVTGQSLADLVQDRIARPLRLKDTYLATGSTWRGPHAHGYEPDAAHMPPDVPDELRNYGGARHDGHVDVSANSPWWAGAAGAVVSSAADWDRFYNALFAGKLLPAAQLAQMRATVPIFPDQPDGPGYGLGIETGQTACGTVWSHDGGIPGYLTTNATDPTGTRTASIVILTEAFAETQTAFPELARAAQELQTAAVCGMFDKSAPAAPSAE